MLLGHNTETSQTRQTTVENLVRHTQTSIQSAKRNQVEYRASILLDSYLKWTKFRRGNSASGPRDPRRRRVTGINMQANAQTLVTAPQSEITVSVNTELA